MKILILSHATEVAGPVDAYEDFLLGEHPEAALAKLSHPLDSYEGRSSTLTQRGKESWTLERHGGMLANLVRDGFLNVRTIWRMRPDVVIGANNFDLAAAILLRPFRRPFALYFAADYSGRRFGNQVLNRAYLTIERLCLRKADVVVSNTSRAADRRRELGLEPSRGLVVPNGLLLEHPTFRKKDIDPHSFIYVGNVTPEHGLLEMVELLAPNMRNLVVIGSGEGLEAVRVRVEELGIPHTFVPPNSRDFVLAYLQRFEGWGLAPYNRKAEWTYYCSPMKVNEYIACGLPVVVSDVPEIAAEVTERQLGVTYGHMTDGLVDAIHAFPTADFEEKARRFYDDYRYDRLYKQIPLARC